MILNEIQQALEIVLASVVFAIGSWMYVDWKSNKAELKAIRDEAIKKGLEDEKTKIHKEYDDKSLDSLIDSSGDVYSKLGSKKDN